MKNTKLGLASVLLTLIFLILHACQENTVVPSEDSTTDETTIETTEEDQDFLLEPGALLGIHFGIKKDDVATQEVRNFLRYTLFATTKGKFPGSKEFYARPDRGEHLGTEVLLWIFQDKPSRDQYFPAKDFPTQKYEKIWEDIQWVYSDTTFFKYFKFGWQTSGFSTDYEIIAVEDQVQKEWFKEGGALVIEHMQLRPEADSLAFLNFIQSEWNMHGASKDPSSIEAIMYASRGYLSGKYAKLTLFNSISDRNEKFPYFGKPENGPEVSELDKKLAEYLEPLEEEPGHYEIIY